jgi:hypothetical protein
MLLKNSLWKFQSNMDFKKEEDFSVNHCHCPKVKCVGWWKLIYTHYQGQKKRTSIIFAITPDNLELRDFAVKLLEWIQPGLGMSKVYCYLRISPVRTCEKNWMISGSWNKAPGKKEECCLLV